MAKPGIGERAPEFTLAGTGGHTYTLSEHRGGWLILAFYPADFTAVCTRQFCAYRDEADQLDELDAVVLGISPQSVESHQRFTEQYGLIVPLLSDPEREAIRAYGVAGPRGLVRRSVFVIDPEGIVRHRHVALLGLRYRDVGDLASALADARRSSQGETTP